MPLQDLKISNQNLLLKSNSLLHLHTSSISLTIRTYSSLLLWSTTERTPVWISQLRPTIWVLFLIRGDARRIAMSSLTVSSILKRTVSRDHRLIEGGTLTSRWSRQTWSPRWSLLTLAQSRSRLSWLLNHGNGTFHNLAVVSVVCSDLLRFIHQYDALPQLCPGHRLFEVLPAFWWHRMLYHRHCGPLWPLWGNQHLPLGRTVMNKLKVGSNPKIWYGFSRGSEHERTTTPAPVPRIAVAIFIKPGGAW